MATLSFTSAPLVPFGRIYSVNVSGTVIAGEIYTVNSTAGIIAQYTALIGDDTAAVALGLKNSIDGSHLGSISPPNPNGSTFFFTLNGTVTSAATTTPPTVTTTTPVPPTTTVTPAGVVIPYGKRFQITYDPPGGGSAFFKPRYRLDILQKNYTGGVTNLKGGPGGIKQNWQTDEAKPGLKGCSLTASILNENQSLPLSTFYSTDDDEFKLQQVWLEVGLLGHTTARLLFEGFLVQDDCNEVMIDYLHEINLTATDGLGLLKGVALDKAPASYEILYSSTEPYEITLSGINTILLVSTAFGDTLQVGDKITIDGGSQFTIKDLIPGSGLWNVYLVEHPATVSSTTGVIAIYRSNLIEKITLLSVIKRCLSATGLNLSTNIYGNIWEQDQVNTSSFLGQTLVDGQTYLKNDSDYDDCYSIIEKELNRFHLTLFQSNGVWNIIRWDEIRYYSNNVPGFSYDKDFNLIGAITLPNALEIDKFDPITIPDSYPETGLSNKILGSYLFVKETFNYQQPKQLLRNYNLQQLGKLLRSYSSGSNTIKEYGATWWYLLQGAASGTFFIRVILDSLGNELERYLVVNESTIQSYQIEVNKGDTFKFSYDVRTAVSKAGSYGYEILLYLKDGTTNYFVREPNTTPATPTGWSSTPGWHFNIPSGDNADQWHTVEIESKPIPADGHLFVTLFADYINIGGSLIPTGTHYKDIRFEYTPHINESTKIVGHTHKSEQLATIKQKEDEEIYIDDAPRNSIAGCLFLNTLTGLLQTRTKEWHRDHLPTEKRKIGNITTLEQLQWKMKSRTILEGNFIGLLHLNKHSHVSMLSVFRSSLTPELNYVFGKLEIDYRNDMFNGTLWEMYKDGEADVTSDYEFKYLYDTK